MPSSQGRYDRRAAAEQLFNQTVTDLRDTVDRLAGSHLEAVLALADAVAMSWQRGGKLLICGNGGSAGDAQHIAAELVGRFLRNRQAYGAIALSTNTSILTSVGNDYGFDQIFARQVVGLGSRDDVLLVISTSGNSRNCIEAVAAARQLGMAVFGFLGADGGRLQPLVDAALLAPSRQTPRIQEIHIAMGHLLCHVLECWRTEPTEPGAGGGDD
jgi:D-sedoheptulose 7-phosphate isomerase